MCLPTLHHFSIYDARVSQLTTWKHYSYRARKWNAMSSVERDAYLAANKDSGNKRFVFLPFRCVDMLERRC